MSTELHITRRQLLHAGAAGASGAIAATLFRHPAHAATAPADTDATDIGAADPRIQGPFLILSTPFTAAGEVDFDALARQACYVDWCGCPGMIWPQSGDSVDLLTTEEKLRGMEVLSQTTRKLRTTALCLGVQGKDTAEMLMFAAHAESLAPPAIISRPPDTGKTEDDLRQYWHALAAVAKRPVFIQTTGGVAYKGPIPSVELLIELARDFPHFGYVKEEAGDVIARTRALLAAKPPIRRVFSARGGYGWLYELRLGSEGLITERAIYADVLTRIWELHRSGSDPAAARDAFSKFLLMINLSRTLPGDLRGYQLYLWKKRGVFQTMVSRHYGPGGTIPASPIHSELQLSNEEIAEIEYRFEALAPYQKPGSPSFAAAVSNK
ncbi:MAG: dihydrodipicolinate synthase family protein [Planctomycetaceae bacterium]|nr:dihydrodipicolinate synthase family protein [Planctomycetaceae bacterium]